MNEINNISFKVNSTFDGEGQYYIYNSPSCNESDIVLSGTTNIVNGSSVVNINQPLMLNENISIKFIDIKECIVCEDFEVIVPTGTTTTTTVFESVAINWIHEWFIGSIVPEDRTDEVISRLEINYIDIFGNPQTFIDNIIYNGQATTRNENTIFAKTEEEINVIISTFETIDYSGTQTTLIITKEDITESLFTNTVQCPDNTDPGTCLNTLSYTIPTTVGLFNGVIIDVVGINLGATPGGSTENWCFDNNGVEITYNTIEECELEHGSGNCYQCGDGGPIT